MELPGRERIQIDAAKIRDYLLSASHPIGRFKAVFFAALGYSAADWQQLESDLRELAMRGEATRARRTKHGQHYEVRGTLRGPSGRVARVTVIWMVRMNEDAPRFITAFPGER